MLTVISQLYRSSQLPFKGLEQTNSNNNLIYSNLPASTDFSGAGRQ